jgi:hypothetical protein
MAKKYCAKITRDIVRTIRLRPLVITGLVTGNEREIAPASVHELPTAAGTVFQMSTKKSRDEFMTAINAEFPGAAIPV